MFVQKKSTTLEMKPALVPSGEPKVLSSHQAISQHKLALAILSIGWLSACGQQPANLPHGSQTKIVNGITLTDQQLPEVVNLSIATSYGYGGCTGTFVNDHQVLTAGHCVIGIRSALVQLSDGSSAYAQAYALHPNYRVTPQSAYDVAVLSFEKGTSPYSRGLASQSPDVDAVIAIVGFGNTEVQPYIDVYYAPSSHGTSSGLTTSGGDGRKRLGYNTLDRKEDGTLVFVGKMQQGGQAGDDAAAAQGDSGGPMLAQSPSGAWEIVGVTSEGRANMKESAESYYRSAAGGTLVRHTVESVDTVYVDLGSQTVKSFLSRYLD